MTPKQKVTAFAKKIAAREGGKRNLTIADIAEVLKCVNEETNGILYVVIHGLPDKKKK